MASPVKRTAFLNWLLKRIELPANEKDCTIELWRRIPHPDTQGMGGPEIDFFVQGDRTIIVGEAKWRSGEGSGQGLSGNKSQLQRSEEHTSELQSRLHLVCRLLLEKKKKT